MLKREMVEEMIESFIYLACKNIKLNQLRQAYEADNTVYTC